MVEMGGCRQTFFVGGGEAYVPALRGLLTWSFPTPELLLEQWGQGAPAACTPSPPSAALSLGRRGTDGGVCADRTVSAPLPKLPQAHTHTHILTSRHKLLAVPSPSPQSARSPPRLLIISLANASHSTVYCLHCFELCIIYTVNREPSLPLSLNLPPVSGGPAVISALLV